jgi:hypothetical protein
VKRYLRLIVVCWALAAVAAFLPAQAQASTPTDPCASSTCTPWVDSGVGILAPIVGQRQSAFLWNYNQVWLYGYTVNGQNVTVGQIRVTAKINLNGRQSQWTQTIGTFSGPAIYGNNEWNCVDDNGILPNTSCSGGWQSRWNNSNGSPNFTTSTFTSTDTNYHQDNSTYWYDFDYFWEAKGYGSLLWTTGTLTSYHFVCKNRTAPCQFP